MKNFNGEKIRTLRDLLSFLAILFIEFIIAFLLINLIEFLNLDCFFCD